MASTARFGNNKDAKMNQVEEEINGAPAVLAVKRATGELRRGRAVDIVLDGPTRRVAALETMPRDLTNRLVAISSGQPTLQVSKHRARVLGLAVPDNVEPNVRSPVPLSELTTPNLLGLWNTLASHLGRTRAKHPRGFRRQCSGYPDRLDAPSCRPPLARISHQDSVLGTSWLRISVDPP